MPQQTSSRLRDEAGPSFSSRRGHASQLSISDPSHHVTEAIGTLYGDEDESGYEGGGRPLSFIDGSSYQEQISRPAPLELHRHNPSQPDRLDPRKPLTRSMSDEPHSPQPLRSDRGSSLRKSQTLSIPSSSRQNNRSTDAGAKPPVSPTLSLRDVQADAAGSQFPLTNIDNPNDIAQELSNLQALRRMSMDVGNSIDPDMPPMGLSAMPVIAPTGDDDENDPSRLLWVPARVHPELAPTEFKSFLEKRVQSIRRRSGDAFLSAEGNLSPRESGSLQRRKSMLSKQIDNSSGQAAVGYVDGAERLGRKRSSAGGQSPELSLDELVKDPARAVQKFAQGSQDASEDGSAEAEDRPILPMAPGMGLKRSTRTTYRKGGSLRSDRGTLSRRLAQRHQDEGSPELPSSPSLDAPRGHGLARVQSEPIAENYSRPKRSVRRQQKFVQDVSTEPPHVDGASYDARQDEPRSPPPVQDQLSIRTASMSSHSYGHGPVSSAEETEEMGLQSQGSFPQRSSSQSHTSRHDSADADNNEPTQEELATTAISAKSPPPVAPPSRRPINSYPSQQTNLHQQYTSKSSPPTNTQSFNDGLGSPSSGLMPGDASRTDSLTFIPTFTPNEKKSDKKSKKDKDDDSSMASSKSGSAWKWLKGVTDDKDKKKEESKRAKAKALVEKAQDNVRLDVIQTSIDKTKGRESLVLDRDNIDTKLLEERKKESNRKSDSKKDKDGSIFSSIFGGSKRREDKDKSSKKSQHLQVPEEPFVKPMQPDVDYNWTRFPLLEERAIYRMAHIKLANPRRPLLSQVLLSNFMYSYLAIVQAMHPQMNVPTSPQQKRLEEETRRKQQDQEYLAQHGMQGDDDENSLDQYNFDYHRVSGPFANSQHTLRYQPQVADRVIQATVQYAESGGSGQVDYVDEAQIYEDEHGNEEQDDYGYNNMDGYGHGVKDYYNYREDDDGHQRHGGDSASPFLLPPANKTSY